MPQGQGYGSLGEMVGNALFGNDINREGAYLEGFDTGSQIKLRSAQTENALAQARERAAAAALQRQERDLRSQVASNLIKPEMLLGALIAGGMNPEQYTGAQTDQQLMGFRDTLADVALSPEVRQGAGLALRGSPVTAGDAFGPGGELFLDIFDPSRAAAVTPTGRAQIGADEALAAQRTAKTANPERFRSGGVTLNLGDALPSELLNPTGTLNLPNDPTTAFGVPGAVGSLTNRLADVLPGIGVPFPDLDTAVTAVDTLKKNSMVTEVLDFPGRPTNFIAQQVNELFPTPRSILQGEENAITKVQQLRDNINRELTAQQQLLPMLENKSSRDKARISIAQLAQLVADYDQFLDAMGRAGMPEFEEVPE